MGGLNKHRLFLNELLNFRYINQFCKQELRINNVNPNWMAFDTELCRLPQDPDVNFVQN